MPKLLSASEAAEFIGTTRNRVEKWARRTENPLPSIKSTAGRTRKIIAGEIDAWLVSEFERDRPASKTPRRPAP